MSIAVTGATGNLGQLVVESLIGRGTAASDIVAVVRNPQKAESLAARGVVVRQADYADASALETALAGVDKLVLIPREVKWGHGSRNTPTSSTRRRLPASDSSPTRAS